MLITIQNSTAENFVDGLITILPTGQVESSIPTDFYDEVNILLAPTISRIQSLATAANISNFNFWELMNWVFVSQYWLLLVDFGQSAPATFQYDDAGNLLSYGPVRYSAENNIFVNETLFHSYNSYLRSTILPLFNYTVAEFLPLNDTNRLQLQPNTTTLKYLYTCTDLKLKTPLSLIVSVIVADWGLISPAFSIFFFLLGAWKLRKANYGISAFGRMLMKVMDSQGVVERREGMNDTSPSNTETTKRLE